MNNTKTKTKSYLFAAIGFLLTLALDQWTKYLASTILRRLESFSLISGEFLNFAILRIAELHLVLCRIDRLYLWSEVLLYSLLFCICTRRCHLHHITDHCVSVLYCLHPGKWEI